jgi:hypothetical protein
MQERAWHPFWRRESRSGSCELHGYQLLVRNIDTALEQATEADQIGYRIVRAVGFHQKTNVDKSFGRTVCPTISAD